MLPRLLFTKLPWTVNDYVNCARDLYHLLAVRATNRLLSCWYSGDKGKIHEGNLQQTSRGRAARLCRVCPAACEPGTARVGTARVFCQHGCNTQAVLVKCNFEKRASRKAPKASVLSVQCPGEDTQI